MSAVRWQLKAGIATVTLSRPRRANALDVAGWHALRDAFDTIGRTSEARVAVLRGEGSHFCAGIDLEVLAELQSMPMALAGASPRLAGQLPDAGSFESWLAGLHLDRTPAQAALQLALERWITDLQDCVNAIERCRIPVIAAIDGACLGGGMDIVCACDIRIASCDAQFSVKEVDMAVTADLGVLQRLPGLVGEGRARELAFTARTFTADEALRIGFITALHGSAPALHAAADTLAQALSAKSPLALQGTKRAALVARDSGVPAGLRQVAHWNAATLPSADLAEALAARREQRPQRHPDPTVAGHTTPDDAPNLPTS